MKDSILGVVRHVLGALGASAATSGYIASSEVDGIVGAVMLLIATGWSIYDKKTR